MTVASGTFGSGDEEQEADAEEIERYEDQWDDTEELKEETTSVEQGQMVADRKEDAADAFEDGEPNPNRSEPHPNDTKTGAFKRANPDSDLSTFGIWETVNHGGVGESGYDNAMDVYLSENPDKRLPGEDSDGGGGSGSTSGDSGGSNRTPTGIQNPFNWQTDDGDVVAPPPDHVSDEGDVAGAGTVIEDDGSLDINPLGDTETDPTEQDYESDPTDDEGAQPTEEPDTALTAWTRAYGGEQALDSIGNAMAGEEPDLPVGGSGEEPNSPGGGSGGLLAVVVAGAVLLLAVLGGES